MPVPESDDDDFFVARTGRVGRGLRLGRAARTTRVGRRGLGLGLRRRSPAVGLVEPAALERHADGQEHLLDRQGRARLSGWTSSVSVSSVNDCWTSMVSPVSRNLYTYVGMAGSKDTGDSAHARHGEVGNTRVPRSCERYGQAHAGPQRRHPRRRHGHTLPPGHQGRSQGADADRRHPGDPAHHRRGARCRHRPHRRRHAAAASRRSRRTSRPTTSSSTRSRDKGKDDVAERLASIGRDWRVTIAYQDDPRGPRPRRRLRREAVGDEPFAVLLPDELMGELVAARPDERRVRQHRRQRGRASRRCRARQVSSLRRDRPRPDRSTTTA